MFLFKCANKFSVNFKTLLVREKKNEPDQPP